MGVLGRFRRRCPSLRHDPEAVSEAYASSATRFRYTLGNLHDFNPDTDAVPFDEMPEIDQWILLRAEELVASAAPGTTSLRSKSVSRRVRFRDHRSERHLFRYLEGPALHRRPPVPRPPLRSNRALSHRLRLVRLLAPPLLHHRRSLGLHGNRPAVRTAFTLRSSPNPASSPPASPIQHANAGELGPSHARARRSLKALEAARQEKTSEVARSAGADRPPVANSIRC